MIHTKRKESSDNDVTVVDLHLTSVTVQEVLKKPRLLNSKCLGLWPVVQHFEDILCTIYYTASEGV